MNAGHKGAGSRNPTSPMASGHKGAGATHGAPPATTGHHGTEKHFGNHASGMNDMINDMKGKGLLQKKAKLGSGERFHALESTLAKRPGVTNPGALAAYIGRKKYGAKKFNSLAAKGKPGY